MLRQQFFRYFKRALLCLFLLGCTDALEEEILEIDPSAGREDATQFVGDSTTLSDVGFSPASHRADLAVESDRDASTVDSGITDEAADSSTDLMKACRDNIDNGGVYSFRALSLTSGMNVSMCDYAGDALLIVNTAANCGFTPQYTGLEGLHRRYINRPLTVLGFLSNDFGDQGGSLAEVEECTDQYMITFEQFHHVGVTSTSRDGQHPLFQWLTNQPQYAGEIPWNFTKFLVSHDGRLLGRWDNLVTPDDLGFQAEVESAVSRAELWQR